MIELKNNFSTKRRQVIFSVILGSLSIGACLFVILSYYNSVKIHIEKISESALNGTLNEIEGWVSEKQRTIDLIGKTLQSFKGGPEEISEFLKIVKNEDEDFIDIFYGTAASPDKNGYAVYATDWVIPQNYDWTTRSWFTQAVDHGSIIISSPYEDLQTKKTIISISKPVVINGVLAGVISSDISTETVVSIIKNIYSSGESIIQLIDSDGIYINTSEQDIEDSYEKSVFIKNKERILLGSFFIETKSFKDRYYAYIGIPKLDWILSIDGSLSSFENIRLTVIRFAVVLMLLAALFIIMLLRTWRSNTQLSIATDAIEQANRDLETTVDERTSSLKNILDNAEEGFLTFGESYLIDPNYSRGCSEIFGKDIKGLSAPDVLFPAMHEIIADFKLGFNLYFQGKSKAQIIFDLTEKKTTIKGRTINIQYKETSGNRILCILNDITLELEVAEKNRIETENQQRILRAIHNKHFFAQFLESADTLFENLEVYAEQQEISHDDKTNLMRTVHTFKGDAGFFGFIETQEISHESETLISDSLNLDSVISCKEILIQIRKAYYKELKSITDTMGENWIEESNGILIPRNEFQKIRLYIKKKSPDDKKLITYIDSFRKISLNELFSRLPFSAASTAEKLGKKIKPMTITGGTLKIVPDRYLPLAESCIHIVKNMVDHGIEFPYERESIQKQPEGSVELFITVDKSSMILEFRDDGRGLNPRAIERTAKEKGIIAQDRSLQNSELFALLFEDGFSTRKETTLTSGRGVGLSAVREVVRNLGGSIELRSKLGKGTTIVIEIPLTGRTKKTKE